MSVLRYMTDAMAHVSIKRAENQYIKVMKQCAGKYYDNGAIYKQIKKFSI